MHNAILVILVLLCALTTILAGAEAHGTHGAIGGQVLDEAGHALAGARVSLESPDLQGPAEQITDEDGRFRVVHLPPGVYTAVFNVAGHQRRGGGVVHVSAGEITRLVVHVAPTEDTGAMPSESHLTGSMSPGLGIDLSSSFFLHLPAGRDFASLGQVAAGVQTDDSGPAGRDDGLTFYGSSGAENAYYIGGVNTTGIELGQQGKSLNLEAIQEIQVKTGGFEAEYGRTNGGIINVITRSGGNEYHGDVFGYWHDDSLQSDLNDDAGFGERPSTFRTTGHKRSDVGFDLGGSILRDRLWFFAAYDSARGEVTRASTQDFSSVLPGAPADGQEFTDKTDRTLWTAKVNWRITSDHSVAMSGFGDPTEIEGVLPGASLASTPMHFTGTRETGGNDYSASYNGVLGRNLIASLRYSRHEESFKQAGPGAGVPGYVDFSDPLGNNTTVWGWVDQGGELRESGFGAWVDQDFSRDQVNADLTFFASDLFGQHQIKGGLEYGDVSAETGRWNGGIGQRIYRFNCSESRCGSNDFDYYYRHRFFVADGDIDPTEATPEDVLRPMSIATA